MTQSYHHGLLLEGPAMPCYQCLILQIVFRFLTDTLSDNDGLQRNFWFHHNDCLMDTLINCLILTWGVSFVKADSRNDRYWHWCLNYMITIALCSICPRFPTFIFACFIYIHIFTSQKLLETSLWVLFDFCALWYRQQIVLAVHLFAKTVLIKCSEQICVLWFPTNNC